MTSSMFFEKKVYSIDLAFLKLVNYEALFQKLFIIGPKNADITTPNLPAKTPCEKYIEILQ